MYESDPVGLLEQPRFLNMAVLVRTSLSPAELLAAILTIEQKLGRIRDVRWGPRTIDIDILIYGDIVCNGQDLELPHPRMMERAFVLQPLVDLDPTLRHPVTKERLADRLAGTGSDSLRRSFDGESLLPEPSR